MIVYKKKVYINLLQGIGEVNFFKTFFYKKVNGLLPEYLHPYLNFLSHDNYSLRSASAYIKNKILKKNIFPYCIDEWNNINVEILSEKKENSFFFCSWYT